MQEGQSIKIDVKNVSPKARKRILRALFVSLRKLRKEGHQVKVKKTIFTNP
jgi:hypothetical protein